MCAVFVYHNVSYILYQKYNWWILLQDLFCDLFSLDVVICFHIEHDHIVKAVVEQLHTLKCTEEIVLNTWSPALCFTSKAVMQEL